MRRKKIIGSRFICFFCLSFLKGEILYDGFYQGKNVKYTDSYVIDLSTCYVQ